MRIIIGETTDERIFITSTRKYSEGVEVKGLKDKIARMIMLDLSDKNISDIYYYMGHPDHKQKQAKILMRVLSRSLETMYSN